jgi:hypothetical protein
MDGASYSPRLLEANKGDHHLNAPYYWLRPCNKAQAGQLQEKVSPLQQLDFFL